LFGLVEKELRKDTKNIPFVNKESSIITHNTYNHANQVSEMNNCNEKLALIKASIKIKNKN
jgi:hypothetical protein